MRIERSHKMIALYIVIGLAVLAALSYVIFITIDNKWILKDNIVTNGEVSYEIGDYYEYDETNAGTIKGLTDVKWKVLGVDKDGHLLIMSASNVANLTMGSKKDLEASKKDFIEGDKRINEIASKYAQGFNAKYARSINLKDLEKLVFYDVSDDITYNYYWTEEQNPYVESEFESGISKTEHNGKFLWFNEEDDSWIVYKKDGDETFENKELIVSVESSLITFDNQLDSVEKKYNKEDKIYKMIYQDDEGKNSNYWTTDKFIYPLQNMVGYGYNVMKGDAMNYTYLTYSLQASKENTHGVRVVVALK